MTNQSSEGSQFHLDVTPPPSSNLSNEIEDFLKTLKIHNKDLDACFNDAVAVHHLTTLFNKQIAAVLEKAHRANNTHDHDNETDEYIDELLTELERGAE